MDTLSQRIQVIIDIYAKSRITELARITGISNTTIGNYVREQRAVGLDFIVSLLENIPDLDPDWLLFGHGNMTRITISNEQKGNYNMNINHSSVVNEQNVRYKTALEAKDEIIKNQREEIEFLRSLLKNKNN